jgi:AcrR family transcriptional regulator
VVSKQHSLREKKFARTKVALMWEFIHRIEDSRFDEISIREVCEKVEVSEGTFFNYFPQKIDVVYYFMQLHSTRVIFQTIKQSKSGKNLGFIEKIFQNMLKDFDNPNVVYEIIAALVGHKQDPKEIEISDLELKYAFPACEGIEKVKVPSVLLENIFKDCIVKAVENNELPSKTDVQEVVIALKALMVGIPLALKIKNFQDSKQHYSKQLKILWTGIYQKYK